MESRRYCFVQYFLLIFISIGSLSAFIDIDHSMHSDEFTENDYDGVIKYNNFEVIKMYYISTYGNTKCANIHSCSGLGRFGFETTANCSLFENIAVSFDYLFEAYDIPENLYLDVSYSCLDTDPSTLQVTSWHLLSQLRANKNNNLKNQKITYSLSKSLCDHKQYVSFHFKHNMKTGRVYLDNLKLIATSNPNPKPIQTKQNIYQLPCNYGLRVSTKDPMYYTMPTNICIPKGMYSNKFLCNYTTGNIMNGGWFNSTNCEDEPKYKFTDIVDCESKKVFNSRYCPYVLIQEINWSGGIISGDAFIINECILYKDNTAIYNRFDYIEPTKFSQIHYFDLDGCLEDNEHSVWKPTMISFFGIQNGTHLNGKHFKIEPMEDDKKSNILIVADYWLKLLYSKLNHLFYSN